MLKCAVQTLHEILTVNDSCGIIGQLQHNMYLLYIFIVLIDYDSRDVNDNTIRPKFDVQNAISTRRCVNKIKSTLPRAGLTSRRVMLQFGHALPIFGVIRLA